MLNWLLGLNEAAVALKPKVMTARELEEQQKEAAKSEEIVKAKASHHSAFLASQGSFLYDHHAGQGVK